MKHALIGDLHPAEAPADDVLLLGLKRRVQAFIDESPDTESVVAYVVTSAGYGRCLWRGHRPPQDQHEACTRLARLLNVRLKRETGFAWVVCLAGWVEPTPERPGYYEQTFMCPRDADGDSPFVVDTEDPPGAILADLEGMVDQAFQGWVRYGLMCLASDIRPQDMRRHAKGDPDPRMRRVMVRPARGRPRSATLH